MICSALTSLKYEDDRFENVSMEFDEARLAPTYRLLWGIPGRSNALNIAQRLGLDRDVVAAARERLGSAQVGNPCERNVQFSLVVPPAVWLAEAPRSRLLPSLQDTVTHSMAACKRDRPLRGCWNGPVEYDAADVVRVACLEWL